MLKSNSFLFNLSWYLTGKTESKNPLVISEAKNSNKWNIQKKMFFTIQWQFFIYSVFTTWDSKQGFTVLNYEWSLRPI